MASAFPNGDVDLVQRARSLRQTIERSGEELQIHQRTLQERLVRIGELLYVVTVTSEELMAATTRLHKNNT